MSVWIVPLCILTCAITTNAELSIDAPDLVESVLGGRVELPCKVKTDKSVKQVVWYRLMKDSSTIVYYFEPPKFNTSSSQYKDRVRLGKDSSSLVFLSVAQADKGWYECRVAAASNGTIVPGEIPEEIEQKIELVVHVPPTGIKINHLTSKQNMTLTCRSSGSTPPAKISWAVQMDDEVKVYPSAKVIIEHHNNLADTVGYFYMTLSHSDQGTVVYCIIKHPKTETVLRENVTLVAPALAHAVPMEFDWLGGSVPYSTFDLNSDEDDVEPSRPAGMIKMIVTPSPAVPINSSVLLSVTSDGAFPEPTYTWWSEDRNLGGQRTIRIDHLEASQQVFCLIENPVGRALMSVELTATGEDSIPDSEAAPQSNDAVVSGAVVGAIAFGSLVLLLVVAFLIYYCMYKPSNGKPSKTDGGRENDFDSYMVKKKAPNFNQPSRHSEAPGMQHTPVKTTPTDKQLLLKNSPDLSEHLIESYSEQNKKQSFMNGSTSTSGYGDDMNGSNGRRSSTKRAISQHLHDFDENASFVGGYGSTFAVDEGSSEVSDDRGSASDSDTVAEDDGGSHNSRFSGLEAHYSLPPLSGSSFETINANQVVEPHARPTDV